MPDKRTQGYVRGLSLAAGLLLGTLVALGVTQSPIGAATGEEPRTPEQARLNATSATAGQQTEDELLAEGRFPSAATGGTCHPTQYRQWSVSSHSYAQLSPVYLALNNTLSLITSGTNGDFCLRCHNQVGANLGESSFISNLERHPTSREGITCVVCHRVDKAYNKTSGRIGLVEGSLRDPVFGPSDDTEINRVLGDPQYRVVTDPNQAGRQIHRSVHQFEPITRSVFCGTCHDVTLFNGFRLEEAFSEYRTSPAAKRGVSCHDCHMGTEQGVPSGYAEGPAAEIGGVPTGSRKLTNHFFAGPDYSVIHPGIFPHNAEAQQLASLEEWLQFDHEAGWGTDEFEDSVADDDEFPERWNTSDDRADARDVLIDQFELLAWAREQRLEVLRNGYHMGEIVTERADRRGIRYRVEVRNATDGHNVPTGFTGERLLWIHTIVTDSAGTVIFESGDRDPNGDLRDLESAYVHEGVLPLDKQLFNLQSKFLVSNLRGSEREAVLPIPYPSSILPFIRPSIQSLILIGEPTTERNHRKGIAPLKSRWAKYRVSGDALTGRGPYRATVRLITQMVPVNLIAEIQVVGFDYGMSPRELADNLVAGQEVLWETEATFTIDE